MDRNDRQAIASLFDRLAEVERRSPHRDAEAEAFIRQQIAQHPPAPYYLAQTVVVQQQALEAAQARIAELEAGAARGGGIVGRQQRQVPQPDRGYGVQPAGPWGGGGFLAGAAQTAMGVAGGVLLGNMIAGALFGGGDAYAADNSDNGNDNNADNGSDGGWGDSGGDGGGGGGGDGGGGE